MFVHGVVATVCVCGERFFFFLSREYNNSQQTQRLLCSFQSTPDEKTELRNQQIRSHVVTGFNFFAHFDGSRSLSSCGFHLTFSPFYMNWLCSPTCLMAPYVVRLLNYKDTIKPTPVKKMFCNAHNSVCKENIHPCSSANPGSGHKGSSQGNSDFPLPGGTSVLLDMPRRPHQGCIQNRSLNHLSKESLPDY